MKAENWAAKLFRIVLYEAADVDGAAAGDAVVAAVDAVVAAVGTDKTVGDLISPLIS